MSEGCCGTCEYHTHDGVDYVCSCEGSEGYGEYTMFQDYCGYWEERKISTRRV